MLRSIVGRSNPSTSLFGVSSRFVNQWTNDPIKKSKMKKTKLNPSRSLGNKMISENESKNYPEKPIEHSGSPYTIEHPTGIPDSFLDANKLKDNPGARHKIKRLGRGPGSGLGKTSGRGHKGQRSRSGLYILFFIHFNYLFLFYFYFYLFYLFVFRWKYTSWI